MTDTAFGPAQAEHRPGGVGTPSSLRAGAGPETPPAPPESKLKKLLGIGRAKVEGTSPPAAPVTKEKRPGGGKGKRTTAAGTIADLYAGIGSLAIRTGSHAPLGRCMQWQAPMAGEMLDEALAGTIIDKVALQRIEKGRARYDLLGAVIGPPLLVYAIERNPANAQTLMPLLASSIRHSLPLMVPAIKKAQAREAAIASATADLFADDPDWIEGTDPVDHILGMMFSGWVPDIPPESADVPDQAGSVPVP